MGENLFALEIYSTKFLKITVLFDIIKESMGKISKNLINLLIC